MTLSLLFTLLSAFLIMLASLSGVVILWKTAEGFVRHNIRFLITFAMGVFAVVAYNLFSEALTEHTNVALVVVSALFGALLLELVTQLSPDQHHHHGTDHDHKHTKIDARRLLFGDAIHNIADGIVLATTFVVDIRIGIATAIGIFLHELVQEISEFFVFKEAGYTTRKALVFNFLTSSTILVGVAIALFTSQYRTLEPLLIAFSAGAFLYVVLRDLLPSTVRAVRRRKQASVHILAGALGVVLMLAIGTIAPGHTHAHTGSGDNSEVHTHE